MLKAVWQDKQNVAWNLLGEIAHNTLLFDKAGLMNELSETAAFGQHRDENVSKRISQSPHSNNDRNKNN